MDLLYEAIIERWLPYDPEFDMSVTFSNENISEVIKKYCSNEAVEKCNNPLSIHPTERRWTINKVLFYRATPENKYIEKMFDDYTEWRNSKRVAEDFIKLFLFNWINMISSYYKNPSIIAEIQKELHTWSPVGYTVLDNFIDGDFFEKVLKEFENQNNLYLLTDKRENIFMGNKTLLLGTSHFLELYNFFSEMTLRIFSKNI